MSAKQVVKVEENSSALINAILKGTLYALSVSLVAILVFAFIIKLTSVSDSVISPINQGIKAISILMGCFTSVKQTKANGLIKGIIIGVMYTLFAFLIFSLLNGQISFGKTLVNDMLFGSIIGAICGVIAVNFKK